MGNTLVLLIVAIIAFFVVPKDALLFFAAGLVVGWNFVSQPAWIALAVAKAKEYFNKRFG